MTTPELLLEAPDEQRRRSQNSIPDQNVAPGPPQLIVTCEDPPEETDKPTGQEATKFGRAIGAIICIIIFTAQYAYKNSTKSRDASPSSIHYIPSYSSPSSSNNAPLPSLPSSLGLEVGCTGRICKDAAKQIVSSFNVSVDPCDDFYDFACQGWQNLNPRPEYEADWSVFSILETEVIDWVVDTLSEKRIQSMVHKENRAFQQAKRYFRKCMDVGTYQDAFGQDNTTVQYMLDTVDEYGGWPMLYAEGEWNSSKFDLLKSITDLKRRFDSSPILNIYPEQLPYVDITNIIMIRKPKWSIRGSSSVLYKDFIVNVSRELLLFKGEVNISEEYLTRQASTILSIQAKILAANARKNYKEKFGFQDNVVGNITLDNIQALLNGHLALKNSKLDLTRLLEVLFAKTNIRISRQQQLIVSDLNYLLGISEFMSEVATEDIANYLHLKMISRMLRLVASRKLQGYVDTLHETTKPVPRSQTCGFMVENKFAFVLGHKYVTKDNANILARYSLFIQARRLFNNMKNAFDKLVSSSNILDHNNLLSLKILLADLCLGYPDGIYSGSLVEREYNGLYLEGNFIAQTMQLNAWSVDKELKTLQQSANKANECKWAHFIGTIGGFNRIFKIYVPLGLLQTPFFDMNLPKSLIYGKLGSILGHEIAHSLTGDGWTETKHGNFTPLSKCMINNYNRYTFEELKTTNVTLNGEVTLEENIADNAGVLAAYKAFKVDSDRSQKQSKMEGLEKYTQDQMFFIGFAQNWCQSSSLQGMKKSLTINNDHSPGRFRVLGTLQNSKEFSQAWKCPVGSNMNPMPTNEHKKCQVF